jgi:thioredoxin 1
MSELTVTKQNFEQEILNSDKPALVDFWAPWCMPCRMIAPIVEEIAEEMQGKAVVGKVNVDEEGELAMQFGVASIPTLIVFKGGKEVKRVVGVQSKAALMGLLD